MQTVAVDRYFTQPPERVFAYLADHKNLEPLFDVKITRLTAGDDGTPNGPGASWNMKFGPLPAFVETLTEVVPNDLIRYRITKGSPLRDHEGVMRFAPIAGGGTHLRYEISFRGVAAGPSKRAREDSNL